MTEVRRVIRIFLASPGDLQEERSAAKEICEEINRNFAISLGYQVELVGWEETITGKGRPQALINRELDQCQLFIGMIWKRWGTPPDNDGLYTSGFEEEFRRISARSELDSNLEIFLLLKNIDDELVKDPGDQLKKVLEFRAEIEGAKKFFYETFFDADEFEKRLRRAVSQYVINTRNREVQDGSTGIVASKVQKSNAISSKNDEVDRNSEEYKNIDIVKISSDYFEQEKDKSIDEMANTIARMRLLISAHATIINDISVLQPHDGNIVFKSQFNSPLSPALRPFIIMSGLHHLDDQNFPFWYCLVNSRKLSTKVLDYLSIYGESETIRRNSIDLIMCIDSVSESANRDRKSLIEKWLADDSLFVKLAALNYLKSVGLIEWIDLVEAEIRKNESATYDFAVEAKTSIFLNNGQKSKALSCIIEQQPSKLSVDLVQRTIDSEDTSDSDMLLSLLDSKSDSVRLQALRLVISRGQLEKDIAIKLLDDANSHIRGLAARALGSSGVEPDENFADKRLGAKTGLASAMLGIGAHSIGKSLLDIWKEAWWAIVSLDKLREIVGKTEEKFPNNSYFVLADREFSKFGQIVRADLADGYAGAFERMLNPLKAMGPKGVDLIESFSRLEEFMRGRAVASSLVLVASKKNKFDLPLVRNVVDERKVEYTDELIEFFRVAGDRSDLSRIVKLVESASAGLGLRYGAIIHKDKIDRVTDAIIALDGDILNIVKDEIFPSYISAAIFSRSKSSQIARLSDDVIIDLFGVGDELLRSVVLSKVVLSLKKDRRRTILQKYLDRSVPVYYSVLYYLDLGISMPEKVVKAFCNRTLRKSLEPQ